MNSRGDQRVLLSVLAHPDDESFGMGGTLAKYARQGVEVHLVCATRGEAGEVPPEYLEQGVPIRELRERELICAAEQLGIRQLHFLDYRDSGMTGSPENEHPQALVNAPLEEVAGKVLQIIRDIEPQVVLTFDPIGGYYHPDHIAIHQAATEAFFLARDRGEEQAAGSSVPQKLYYHTIPKQLIRFNVRLLSFLGKDPSRWGKNQDIDLTELAEKTFPVHARIAYGKVRKQKAAAASCHASQGGAGLIGGVWRMIFRLFGSRDEDQFMRAYPDPQDGELEKDLFANLSV